MVCFANIWDVGDVIENWRTLLKQREYATLAREGALGEGEVAADHR
jgi:hypothetical protein